MLPLLDAAELRLAGWPALVGIPNTITGLPSFTPPAGWLTALPTEWAVLGNTRSSPARADPAGRQTVRVSTADLWQLGARPPILKMIV